MEKSLLKRVIYSALSGSEVNCTTDEKWFGKFEESDFDLRDVHRRSNKRTCGIKYENGLFEELNLN